MDNSLYDSMKKLIVVIALFASTLNAQQSEWFPDSLLVQPFAANYLEPRMGFQFELNKNNLRLIIGSSMDIYRRTVGGNAEFTIGADLFTYSFLRGEHNFHFPVDAIDYLFGINLAYKLSKKDYNYGFRARLSHISAHFVDGHYDGYNAKWRNNRNPIVYSREFVEIIGFYSIASFRGYVGGTYIFHIDPTTIKKDSYQLGVEYFYNNIFGGKLIPFAAYDMRIIHLDKYSVNHSFVLGLKFGRYFSKGFRIYYEYYNGKNIHGEYFDEEENYNAIGFNLEF